MSPGRRSSSRPIPRSRPSPRRAWSRRVADGEANIQLNAGGKKQKLHVTVKGARTPVGRLSHRSPSPAEQAWLQYRAVPRRGSRQGRTPAFPLRRRRRGGFRSPHQSRRRPPDQSRRSARQPALPEGHRRARTTPAQNRRRAKPRSCSTWLTGGAPWSSRENARITALKLYPDERRLPEGADARRLLVTAIFSDGQVRDVTADAAYHSSESQRSPG